MFLDTTRFAGLDESKLDAFFVSPGVMRERWPPVVEGCQSRSSAFSFLSALAMLNYMHVTVLVSYVESRKA